MFTAWLAALLLTSTTCADGAIEYSEASGGPIPTGTVYCYKFSQPFPACGGCQSVNNCGSCNGGSCGAWTYQICVVTRSITPTLGDGHEAIIMELPCFVVFECGHPCTSGPPDSCGLSPLNPVASQETEYVIMIGPACVGTGS